MQRSVIKDVEIKALLKQALTHQIVGFLFADFFFTFCQLDLVSDTEFVIKYHALRSIFWCCQNTRPTLKLSLLMPVNFLKKTPTITG
jgi:hypothetical protein